MFGSTVLDVFIGLVLIYLLYSLLITIVGEMIATWLGIRARILKQAMEKMLNDDPGSSSGTQRLISQTSQFFLYESEGFKYSFAGRFYEHPSIKYLGRGQKKFRFSFQQGKPAYISKENFSDTLIQMFRNKGTGRDDIEKINFCLKYNTLHIQPQTLSHLKNLLADANNDLAAFKGKLIQWFNDTMDRTNGWYKRKLQLILFWLGFILAVAFNVDSIKIAQQLSHDKDARSQMVQMAIQASDSTSVLAKAIRQTKDSVATDTLLRKSFRDVNKATEDANKILGLGWQTTGKSCKLGYILRQSMPWHLRFWGFVITALMLSLGAPFWFDLLKKLVAIRGAGIKPEEREENKTNTVTENPTVRQGANPVNPAPVTRPVSELASAVKSLKGKIASMSGIISVKQGFIKDTDNRKNEAIEVHILNQGIKDNLIKTIGNTFQNFPVNYLINSVAVSHAVLPGQTILNLGNVNGVGTLGCFVIKEGSGKNYLLSCWHVLKGNFDYTSATGPAEIKNYNDVQIARIEAGALTNSIDVGFAALISSEKVSNDSLNIKKNWRLVMPEDAFDETPVVFKGATSGNPKKASIYQNSTEATLKYPNGNHYHLQDLISLTAYDDSGEKSAPSEPGDSGAVVIDADGSPLGVVIGGDDLYTYVAKFSNIISENAIYSEYKILT